ncbi:serine/threonine protein kinase nrc-2, putative [Entamoeba invadens IP1]|uniref:serine/threonine protein kinase nrc-2, putative n=1 Tax=Entamoeba invadens IP1 TaxID=370355 RepID=UPI0002C3E948|nr:serine/threonine protein kinase nrc-2, putative [Entamoeba invadens IP1]ELP90527.1 serine/threonine protein kinase nrc-2, putative [Entamoeba invadens IP1]|eukprot:XP_004257298.1 serine/threonine protein kinase nrc-2, putative [Entamoeba invadens IP1]
MSVANVGQSKSSESDDDSPGPIATAASKTVESLKGGLAPLMTLFSPIKQCEFLTPTDFKKIAMIGRGSTGRVFLVQRKNTKEYYSMKVMDKRIIELNKKQNRVDSEREILERLKHPFLVNLYAEFESPKYHLFVMTYCAGGDFWRLLNRQPGKCFKENVARFYLAEVVCALEYLHMEDIVYRDLKPENLLLHESGNIMLGDFDLSKVSEKEEAAVFKNGLFGSSEVVVEPQNFRSNSFVGTDEYLAPEILSKTGHSASVDWWTLGVLMYEFLYGCNPFVASSKQETFQRIQKGEFSFPRQHRYPVSKDAKDLIRELLDIDSDDRLGSKGGAPEIKQHDFFASIKFALIRNMTPPIVPKLMGPRDVSNFFQYKPYDDDVPDDWAYVEEEVSAEDSEG